MTASVAEELAGLLAENRCLTADCERMRGALEEIAHRTIQRDLNALAHQALGHELNPWTERMLVDLPEHAPGRRSR